MLVSFAQESTQLYGETISRIGFNYGQGSQQKFPFESENYTYDTKFYKLQVNFRLKEKRNWRIELNFEPSIYRSEHVLLNEEYVQPRFGHDYLQQRSTYTSNKVINEYALNIGLQLRYMLFEKVSTYLLGSIGPMIADTDTERLKKGFAFSDVAALGILVNADFMLLDMRIGMRHVSNAGLQFPNGGYNSSNIEFGISLPLKNKKQKQSNNYYLFSSLF